MHPPLDRPHPDCQGKIDKLQECHENRSVVKFWACNELKYALDKCFKEEKARLLKHMNKDMHEKRKREDEAWADAAGHGMTFEDYLKQDKEYQDDLKKTSSRGGIFQQKSTGGMPS